MVGSRHAPERNRPTAARIGEVLGGVSGHDVDGPALSALATGDDTIRAQVGAAPERYGHVVCPHTACAINAYEQLEVCRTGPWIAAATANPAKFDTVVEPILGHDVPVPAELAKLLGQPRKGEAMANDLDALRTVLRR